MPVWQIRASAARPGERAGLPTVRHLRTVPNVPSLNLQTFSLTPTQSRGRATRATLPPLRLLQSLQSGYVQKEEKKATTAGEGTPSEVGWPTCRR
jgi:hypothetical protein